MHPKIYFLNNFWFPFANRSIESDCWLFSGNTSPFATRIDMALVEMNGNRSKFEYDYIQFITIYFVDLIHWHACKSILLLLEQLNMVQLTNLLTNRMHSPSPSPYSIFRNASDDDFNVTMWQHLFESIDISEFLWKSVISTKCKCSNRFRDQHFTHTHKSNEHEHFTCLMFTCT